MTRRIGRIGWRKAPHLLTIIKTIAICINQERAGAGIVFIDKHPGIGLNTIPQPILIHIRMIRVGTGIFRTDINPGVGFNLVAKAIPVCIRIKRICSKDILLRHGQAVAILIKVEFTATNATRHLIGHKRIQTVLDLFPIKQPITIGIRIERIGLRHQDFLAIY